MEHPSASCAEKNSHILVSWPNIFHRTPINGHLNAKFVDSGKKFRLFCLIEKIQALIHFYCRYKTKRLLGKHQITHTEYEHKCTECDRAFRKKASLRVHMESHTGVINKPLFCDVCGKSFRKNYELTVGPWNLLFFRYFFTFLLIYRMVSNSN